MLLRFLIAICLLNIHSFTYAKSSSIAILGDSLATGAGAHPKIKYDTFVFWDILQDKISLKIDRPLALELSEFGVHEFPIHPPRILSRSKREFNSGLDWVFQHLVGQLGAKYTNTAELSWGFLLGRKLGIESSNIHIAAQNGHQSKDIFSQAGRLVEATRGTLPSDVIILFTGNDLCAQHVDLITSSEVFQNNLELGLHFLINNKKDSDLTRIYLPGFLTTTQLMSSPKIQEKVIKTGDETISCQDLRERRFTQKIPTGKEESPAALMSSFLPPNPFSFCPTLFGNDAYVKANVSKIANRIHAYRKATSELVGKMNEVAQLKKKNIEFKYLSQASTIQFDAHEIAEDCFHLSAAGQMRLAKEIYQEISSL